MNAADHKLADTPCATQRVVHVAPFLVLMATAACATSSQNISNENSATPIHNRYMVTVVSASIASQTPEGQPWDKEEPSAAIPLIESLATLSSIPFLPDAIAAMAREVGSKSDIFPSPQVEVHVGDMVLQSGPIRKRLNPKWHWSFALDRREHDTDSQITFVIRDAQSGMEIGKFPTTVGALLSRPETHVEAPKSVGLLQIAVEPLSEGQKPSTYHFTIPANQSTMSRILNQGPQSETDWRAIRILNGDSIHVVAKGTVTLDPGKMRFNEPVDPNGIQVTMGVHPHPLQGCEEMPSGALVAILAGKCSRVGTDRNFLTVKEAGQLLLVINDADEVGGNSGQFDVQVEVTPSDIEKSKPAAP
jgi:hypothetical protein